MRLVSLAVALALVVPFQGSRNAEITSAIKVRVDDKKSSGMVVGTVEPDGTTSVGAYGDPGPDAKPLDADSVFEIGSITKVFTATILADMVDRGEVALSDPVAKYLPETVKVPSRGGAQITLLDLTTQTSGLPRMPTNFLPRDMNNPYADYTPEQLFAFLSGYTLTRDIGSVFEYSNLGVGLLGQALSRRAGKSYPELVSERVLVPLGMTHSGVAFTPWMREHLAVGHNALLKPTGNWDLPTLAGAGALRSTMGDMLIFAKANLGWAPSQSAAATRLVKVMATTHDRRRPTTSPDTSIGMNWLIRRVGDQEIVWHNGGTGGYRTWMGFDKAARRAAVVLTNSAIGHDDLGASLLTAVKK